MKLGASTQWYFPQTHLLTFCSFLESLYFITFGEFFFWLQAVSFWSCAYFSSQNLTELPSSVWSCVKTHLPLSVLKLSWCLHSGSVLEEMGNDSLLFRLQLYHLSLGYSSWLSMSYVAYLLLVEKLLYTFDHLCWLTLSCSKLLMYLLSETTLHTTLMDLGTHSACTVAEGNLDHYSIPGNS